ncbi:Efflux pump antibiotic resistance protein [Fusarium sp. Ph1]|nr:Efflux pump antibiotic resistance protein [Fusarium sp. Ph1]
MEKALRIGGSSAAERNTLTSADEPALHPRDRISSLEWAGTLATIYLTGIINGMPPPRPCQSISPECPQKQLPAPAFQHTADPDRGFDVSNVANIQPRLYEVFGHIELLPWIGLSYSLANFATLAIARAILYCFDMRWVYIVSLVVFLAGAAMAGAAQAISTVIAGRAVMGIGGSICQHCATSYLAIYARPAKDPILYAVLSGLWAVGLAVGGPVGSAFSENSSLTWRWAFYINLPFLGLAFASALKWLPSERLVTDLPLCRRLARVDVLGIILQISATVLFAVAGTLSGPVWAWGSPSSAAAWSAFGVVFIVWALQQYYCVLTTAHRRVFPAHILRNRELLFLWVGSACAGATYAVALYYMPLFLAFTRGLGALEQTERVLPFILTFIATVLIVGGCLFRIGWYKLIYVIGGAATLAAGAALAMTLEPDTPEPTVMGLAALVGFGLGLHFQHGTAISNVITKGSYGRAESVAIFNMALMGGISMTLVIAGAIYENRGFSLLSSALGREGYDEHDIREALSGVVSTAWRSSDPYAMGKGVEAASEAIALNFWLIASSGAVCLACGLWMRWEKLGDGLPKEDGNAEV